MFNKVNLIKMLALIGGVATGGNMILNGGDPTTGFGIILASLASASGFHPTKP